MDDVHKLSIGDNSLTGSDADHANIDYAASGDVDKNKEKEEVVCSVLSKSENTQEQGQNKDTLCKFNEQAGDLSVAGNDVKYEVDNSVKLSISTCIDSVSEITLTDSSTKASTSATSNVKAEQLKTDDNKTTDKNEKRQSFDDTSNAFLQPLLLNEAPGKTSSNNNSVVPLEKFCFSSSSPRLLDTQTPCMFCDHIESDMDASSHFNEYLCHLLVEHKLVIADVKLIADLQSYAVYWKKRFSEESVDAFCSKIRTNTGSTDVAKSEDYYLLCDALPEDKNLREKLQFEKLKKLLLRQEFERKDLSFSRTCPFCNRLFQGNRIVLFNHMNSDHSFNIGHPDNIVNVRELLDEIEKKLNNLQCLFCENFFRDRVALREHMRKKVHRRLNPANKEYDKYYMINYLELGKNWQIMHGESERLDANLDDWSGWCEEMQKVFCFFCNASYNESSRVYEHMKEEHDFDLVQLKHDMQLSFYQQIKLINYIRRKVHLEKQEGCDDVVVMVKEDLKSSTKWNQPQYYFPTYEDDLILCQLEDKEGLFEPEDTFVIGEDGIDCRAIISNSVLTDLVVQGFFDC